MSSLYFLGFLYIVATLLELIGISLIAPLASALISGTTEQSNFLDFIWDLNITKKELVLGILVIFFTKFITVFYVNLKLVNFGAIIESRLRLKFLNIILYSNNILKDKSDMLFEGVDLSRKIARQYTSTLIKVTGDIVFLIGAICIVIFVNPGFAIALLFFLFLIKFLYQNFAQGFLGTFGKKINNLSVKIFSLTNYIIESKDEIRFMKGFDRFVNKFKDVSSAFSKTFSLNAMITNLIRPTLEFLFVSPFLLFIFLNIDNEKTMMDSVPYLIMIVAFVIKSLPIISSLGSNIVNLDIYTNGLKRLSNFGLEDQNFDINFDHEFKSSKFEEIKLSGIEFGYDKKQTFLNISNFHIEKNDFLTICGPSGVGKSTFLKIFLGVISPTKALFSINGSKIKHSDWSKFITPIVSYVSQEPKLIKGTIFENITIFDKNLLENRNKALKCLKLAQADKLLIQYFDENTELLEGGISVSTGQRIRIAIARAFYQEKEIMIFDEPTASLDTATKKDLIKTFKLLSKIKTLLIVSHDEDLINSSKRVVKFDKH